MVWMNCSSRLAWGALLLIALAQAGCAQTGPQVPATPADATQLAVTDREPVSSALDAELFYQLLLSELNARGEEPAAAFSLMLDAARKNNDPALYQRAVEIAFQSRAGDAALQAARAWKEAHPASREANRYVLQILLALNRVPEAMEPLRTELALAGEPDRGAVLTAIPRLFARVGDKQQAAALVEQALQPQLSDPATAAVAWTTVGRLRLAAGDSAGALVAAQLGQAADAHSESPVLLALELMEPRLPQAEPIVRKYLQGRALPELRMGYARALIDAQRYTEAAQQLRVVTRDKPELAQGWLALGTLQVQENRLADAEASLKKYVELAQAGGSAAERSRGLAQAYLALAQVAEKRRDFAAANAWLDRIDDSQELVAAQSRRASILAQQGRLDDARKLIHALPDRTPAQARVKLSAEVQLLREQKRYKAAYDLLDKAVAKDPGDPDLLYDQAMLAEKMDRLGDMERLLRQVIATKPDFHHAYNALGYSLADRGVRLGEARQLIRKALEFAPGDPYITDSLGWVEFRLGNRSESLRILQGAYKDRPDAEIAAHLGEVLWSLGQHDKAQAIWREGLLLDRDNETLQQTIKRLGFRP